MVQLSVVGGRLYLQPGPECKKLAETMIYKLMYILGTEGTLQRITLVLRRTYCRRHTYSCIASQRVVLTQYTAVASSLLPAQPANA